MDDPSHIPDHHSAVRHIVNRAHGLPYQPLRDLDEARRAEDAVLVMEGDWGGQIYLVCPVRLVRCSEAALRALLRELDAIAWEGNVGEGAGIYYERARPGEVIAGGMGGGMVAEDLWLHEEFVALGMAERVRGILTAAEG